MAKTYIFGAGRFGQAICGKLKKYNDSIQIAGFIDNAPEKTGIQIDGVTVFSIHNITDEMKKSAEIFVTILDWDCKVEIINQLEQGRFSHVYLVHPNSWRDDAQLIEDGRVNSQYITELKKEGDMFVPVLPYLETHIMNGCLLNCKGCSHFSNLYRFDDAVPFESFQKDMIQLSQRCYIVKLRLLGGEPLMNPSLLNYLKIARERFPYSDIRVATNGLLVLKLSEEVLQYLSESDIVLDITIYQETYRFKEQLEDLLESYQVRYQMDKENLQKFNKCLTLYGTHDGQRIIEKCSRKNCMILKDGNIYRCPIAAYVPRFNEVFGQNIKTVSLCNIYHDGMDKLKELSLGREIKATETCNYCVEAVDFPWEVSHKPKMEEWLVQ